MTLLKQADISGRDFFKSLYASGLEQEVEWLRRGAAQKVNSIETFLAGHSITAQTILELGCGPGAVICECRRRSLARRYIGVDYSGDAINHLRTNAPEIEAIQADITAPDFSMEETVDVVVLTHVIEHLENPHEFLAAMLQKLRFKYLIVEVPLEDLLGARLKNLIKEDRRINTSGHVQFFTASSFLDLLTSHGLRSLDRRRYVPINSLDTIRFLRDKDGLSQLSFLRMIVGSVLARVLYPIWSRLYYSHYAVLCSRSDSLPSDSLRVPC